MNLNAPILTSTKPTTDLRALDITFRGVPRARRKEFDRIYAAYREQHSITKSVQRTLFVMGLDKVGAAVKQAIGRLPNRRRE